MNEHLHQVALMQWAAIYSAQHPEISLLFAIPNGGKRNISVAKKLKAEGLKPGVPDLFLPVAKKGFHGLFIEMKAATGSTSKLQKEWISELIKQRYKVVVCKGWEVAMNEIKSYLEEI